jgi:hypothetical protein
MPGQGFGTRCSPVQPFEHHPVEIHASCPPGIAIFCILLSLTRRTCCDESSIATLRAKVLGWLGRNRS